VGLVVFGRSSTAAPGFSQQSYFLFPLLIWAAIRFGVRGAATGTLAMAAVAIWGTAVGGGPFADPVLHRSLAALQTFIAVCSATLLLLGAASDERRRALNERERLISIASHELRTPLTALQLQLHVLWRKNPDSEALAGLRQQVGRMTSLVDNLLDASRLSSGMLDLELDAVDLSAVARDVAGRFSEAAKDAQCTVTVSGAASVIGRWDPLRLEQVLSNLLTNALKYGANGPIELSVEADRAFARLRVTDHGVGIAPRDQRRIFEPFERLSTVPHAGGFGLGLWIVRQITQALGGVIRVQSAVGQGATFTVELPLAGPPAAVREQRTAREALGR
jgi:signal transduction histidine kinase